MRANVGPGIVQFGISVQASSTKAESKSEVVESWLTHGHLGKVETSPQGPSARSGEQPIAPHGDIHSSCGNAGARAADDDRGLSENGGGAGQRNGCASGSEADAARGAGAVGLFGDTPISPMFQRPLDTSDGTYYASPCAACVEDWGMHACARCENHAGADCLGWS